MEERKSKRIESIDLLRGVVMVIMALDHVRDYFHINAIAGNDPTNMETTTPILFFTRFITHFCAPTFVFLAGTSAFLYGQRKSKKDLFKFLFTRGLWLVFVEIAIMNLIWWFDPTYSFINLQVIWAIGLCMIGLSFLVFLPKKILLIIGLVIVFGHNLLDGIQRNGQDLVSLLWYMLHQGGIWKIDPPRVAQFMYPVLPWFGVIILGYVFGSIYRKDYNEKLRKRILAWLGLGSIICFFLLRFINNYGNPNPWTSQKTPVFTLLSFLNVEKYPPSLDYLLITLGAGFLFLYLMENIKNRVTSFFIVFGRVPFFYYVLHILLIHILAIIGLIITGKDWHIMILESSSFRNGALSGYGYSLWVVYLVWIFVVAVLYYPSKKYMEYKIKHRTKWWLSYL